VRDPRPGFDERPLKSARADFREQVRARLPATGLSGPGAAALIEEFVDQVEDIYDSLMAEGWTDRQARSEALASLDADDAAWNEVVGEHGQRTLPRSSVASPLLLRASSGSLADRFGNWLRGLVRGGPLSGSLILTLGATTAINVAVFTLLDATL